MLLGTNDICSGAKLGKPSAIRQLSIPPGRGRTAIFPVVPLAAGVKYIHVKASSSSGESDAVKVELNVLVREKTRIVCTTLNLALTLSVQLIKPRNNDA